ncbi:CPBP family intramembrane glutamic endopeptidase [Sporosarcina sp. Te-1]|uniref:CPBP family intramembrane glutamic endopeptidase n=1 Tax=Sporosarcina sp. Te-1 TaxID=2818390 RepID=UPI001A9E4DB2|nr:CPBP family intramembrane glutamic endopeptidase [Sporosarcina sp. Te-1]QTD40433.1 CPBP family intramembrane metalloprotease [Sporosarcina sp. Te-1]
MKKGFGILFPILSMLILLWIEQGIGVAYIWKTTAKLMLFLFIPLVLFRSSRFSFLRIRQTDRTSIKRAVLAGLAVMASIIGAFLLLRTSIDLNALQMDLADSGITPIVFPIIALYILFGNSLLEEFFFRGLLPDLLGQSKLRMLLPPFFFAIYHIAIFLPWFTAPILLLAIAGLWTGGFIFQFTNQKSGTILPSWIIHMSADLGILLIGAYLLYFY